jgi:UPF0755 protein
VKKLFKITAIVFIALIAAATVALYFIFLNPNIAPVKREKPFVFIATRSTPEDVFVELDSSVIFNSKFSFRLASRLMRYPLTIYPGRYKIHSGMTNLELLKMLRSGKQSLVDLVFNNLRTKEQFAERVGEQIEVSGDSLLYLMRDAEFLSSYDVDTNTVLTLFIPNTYEFFWNTSGAQFFRRMKTEYDKFWNEERKQKASQLGLTPAEVTVLASIVEQETQRGDERPVIAGVYLNRLNKNWNLEADPTLVFALGDFSIKRVLSEYKKIDSPYNTYKYAGLPPGPICIPSIISIDAVLNRFPHNYMYFCARDDFSGYHAFASTYAQHQANARRFHKALNQRGILR